MSEMRPRLALHLVLTVLAFLALSIPPRSALAQETGTVTGTVTRAEGGELSSVSVSVASTGQSTVTGTTSAAGRRMMPPRGLATLSKRMPKYTGMKATAICQKSCGRGDKRFQSSRRASGSRAAAPRRSPQRRGYSSA
jgi:hypothetical protein